MRRLVCLSVICFFTLAVESSVYDGNTVSEYLIRFGYLDENVMKNSAQISDDDMEAVLSKAISNFQIFTGLAVTGKVNYAIVDIMKRPRCGIKDEEPSVGNIVRQRRYATYSNKWAQQEITYRVSRYPQKTSLTRAAVDEVVHRALSTWASVTNLTFHRVSEHAVINIAFVSPYQGNHNVLNNKHIFGYTVFPPGGMVYLNDEWPWTIRRTIAGTNLFNALMHELGHALGLRHSTVPGSVMQPYISLKYDPHFKLHSDDVQAIQALYGRKTKEPPNLCADSSLDAIFEYPTGIMHVFKGEYYWKINPDGLSSGYPQLITQHWPSLPSNIDAATASSSGKVYFFKDDKYWTCKYNSSFCSNSSYISMDWPGIPNNVDGVMGSGKPNFYFFKSNLYWQYNASERFEVAATSPKPITDWGGVEGVLDDALYIENGLIYFFSKGFYYRYNPDTGMIEGHPNYARQTGIWWFRCGIDSTEERTLSFSFPSPSTTTTPAATTKLANITNTIVDRLTTTTSTTTTTTTTTTTSTPTITTTTPNTTAPATPVITSATNILSNTPTTTTTTTPTTTTTTPPTPTTAAPATPVITSATNFLPTTPSINTSVTFVIGTNSDITGATANTSTLTNVAAVTRIPTASTKGTTATIPISLIFYADGSSVTNSTIYATMPPTTDLNTMLNEAITLPGNAKQTSHLNEDVVVDIYKSDMVKLGAKSQSEDTGCPVFTYSHVSLVFSFVVHLIRYLICG